MARWRAIVTVLPSNYARADPSAILCQAHTLWEAPMTSNSMKIAAALVATAFLSAPPQPPATAQTKAPAKAPEFMFVQTAKDIAYKDGVLTLHDVSPMTVFFSDRPQRIVGVVRNNPRLNGNNLTYDVRTLEGDLPTTGIMSTLFIDGSGGDWIKSNASCGEDGDWTRAGGAYRIVC